MQFVSLLYRFKYEYKYEYNKYKYKYKLDVLATDFERNLDGGTPAFLYGRGVAPHQSPRANINAGGIGSSYELSLRSVLAFPKASRIGLDCSRRSRIDLHHEYMHVRMYVRMYGCVYE